MAIGRVLLSASRGNLLISDEYRRLNAEMHIQKPAYGTSAAKWATKLHGLALRCQARDVLDYGCGKGTLKQALAAFAQQPYTLAEYDPAIPGKEDKPLRADLVFCGDVLEHIEPGCLYGVLDDIRNIARVGVLLVVSTRESAKHLPDGRNAHLIVEPPMWWLPKLLDRWLPDLFQDRGGEFLFIGRAR